MINIERMATKLNKKVEIRCTACQGKLGEYNLGLADGELFILCKRKLGTGEGKCNVLNRIQLSTNVSEAVSPYPKTRVLRA